MLILPALFACADFNKLKDTLDDVTNPLVMVGTVLGVEQPLDPNMSMEGSEFGTDAIAYTLLADASSVAEMSDNPVGGAGARLMSDSNGSLTLVEEDLGAYTADSADGLMYVVGEDVRVVVDWEGEHAANVKLPAPAVYDIDPDHQQGEGAVVNLSDQDFDSAFVVVYDVLNAEITFDNRPTDIVAIYNWTNGEGTAIVDIPGSAFARESIYGLGVCGLKHSENDAFEDANTLLSSFVTGKFTFDAVYTVPQP